MTQKKNNQQGPGRLGILAGAGDLPWIGARMARQQGETDLRIFYYTSNLPPADLEDCSERVVITKMFSSVLKALKKQNVTRLLLLGKAAREILFENPGFDVKTVWYLTRMKNRSDYTIFSTFADAFAKEGVTIIPQNTYLAGMNLPVGRYGKKCSKDELENILFGMEHAREINRLDIGQTVVVAGKSVMAVEGAEGTDRCIERGGELSRKKGAIVCKVGKINHDLRFDMPVTGFTTLESMGKTGCRVLAIESKNTFVLHPDLFLKKAGELGITVFSVEPENLDDEIVKKLNGVSLKVRND